MQKGCEFISKPNYVEQFVDRLGYEPFPGTLNIELSGESDRNRNQLDESDAVLIEGWSDGDESFGAVLCYPARIEKKATGERFEQCHVIVPRRTEHERDVLEIIAPTKLRKELELVDDDQITIHAPKP
jgi:riboflavin kinase